MSTVALLLKDASPTDGIEQDLSGNRHPAKRLARFATWEWDLATGRVAWSAELTLLLGRESQPRSLGRDAVLTMVESSDRGRIAELIARSIQERRPFRFEHRAVRPDGTELVLHHEADVVEVGPAGEIGLEAVVIDVTEIKNSDREMQSLASFDELTGLMNRLSFVNLLESAGRRLDGSSAPPVAIGLLDVDRFKEVNEILGYAVGDRLLKEIGARLLSSVRKGDCVAREGDDKPLTVARRGGDEFLILLSDIGEAHDAALAGRRILDALRVPFRIEGQEVYLSASLGITFATEASASTEELLRQAEIAMYSAKELGRNTIQFFEETMDRSVVERFDIENRLRRAIGRNELELHYQPLVRPGSREVVGVEALVRWRHPERGLLSADAFVPVAEETGLIVGIGRWVLRTACRQLQTWRRSGLSPLRLSVNLSPREVRAPGFVASLAKILEETETEPSQLELELTERGVMNDGRTLEVLLRLKEIGVRLAVDDFGTGNTTFQYLKSFPLDTIKIDKSFTEGIAENPRDAAITKALLAMAHRLDLNVVAEGVETEEQLRFLSENECDQVQGYLFGRPIPAAELTHELSRFGNAAIA